MGMDSQLLKPESLEQVMYWRNVKRIHNWFVTNVQDGINLPDGKLHKVTKEKLMDLMEVCRRFTETSYESPFDFVDDFDIIEDTYSELKKITKSLKNNEYLYYKSSW